MKRFWPQHRFLGWLHYCGEVTIWNDLSRPDPQRGRREDANSGCTLFRLATWFCWRLQSSLARRLLSWTAIHWHPANQWHWAKH